jgi:hypothetical protein
LMIMNLGLDSCFGGLEAIYTALADEFPRIQNNSIQETIFDYLH